MTEVKKPANNEEETQLPQTEKTEKTEKSGRESLSYPLKVIVSPVKALREITQNPRIWGFLLIIGLYMLAVAGEQYAKAARIFLDQSDVSVSLLSSNLFGNYLTIGLVQNAVSIVFSWITYAGVLLLLAKLLNKESKLQNSFIIVVGYVFATFVIYVALNALVIPTFPEIHFDATMWTSGSTEDLLVIQDKFAAEWGSLIVAQVLTYLSFVFNLWLVALGAIAIYVVDKPRFGKALMISVIAYFLSVFLTLFLTALFFISP